MSKRRSIRRSCEGIIPAATGDIRTYFPSTVVRVMQQDAIDRFEQCGLVLGEHAARGSKSINDAHRSGR